MVQWEGVSVKVFPEVRRVAWVHTCVYLSDMPLQLFWGQKDKNCTQYRTRL